jgi:hypothetical protein
MMPRYFFNVIDGKFLVDDEGTECAGMREVRAQAISTAGAILKDGGDFPNDTDWQMHITDESKRTVLKLHFSSEEPALSTAHRAT